MVFPSADAFAGSTSIRRIRVGNRRTTFIDGLLSSVILKTVVVEKLIVSLGAVADDDTDGNPFDVSNTS